MKTAARHQAEVRQTAHEFPPHSSGRVYTDQASHAATRGQFALEQTWCVEVAAMDDAGLSPLHALQCMVGRELA